MKYTGKYICSRFYITELLVVILICNYCIDNYKEPKISTHTLYSNINYWIGSDYSVGDIRPSFLKKHLIIDWDYYGYLATNNIKKVQQAYFGGTLKGPIFFSTDEKKPYYLFNLDINYVGYPLKLFRNFTKGDGTPEFIDNNKEIKAVIFYLSDLSRFSTIERNVKEIVMDDACLKKYHPCKKIGIMHFYD